MFRSFFQANYRTIFVIAFLAIVFYFSKQYGYILFHTLVELFSIVIAFAVFIVAWNSRKMQDNKYLHLVGISYIFIGALDLLHTLSYKGMNIIPVPGFLANQFWVSTRFLEAATFLVGFLIIERKKKFSTDVVFLYYFFITLLIVFSILIWQIFPVCFIEGVGQTPFKVYTEYLIIAILLLCAFLLVKKKDHFSTAVYRLLLASIIFTTLSECCFAVYVSNVGHVNELGHYGKLVAFFLIYKANVETGFVKPTFFIFKNLKDSEEKYRSLAENLPGLVLRFDAAFTCIYSNSLQPKTAGQDLVNKGLTFTDGDELSSLLIPLLVSAKETGFIQHGAYSKDQGENQSSYSIQVIPEYGTTDSEGTFLVICQDVSALKKSEKELQLLNQTKDKLFSVIAHDLKNPFTALLSYSELISKSAQKIEREKIGHMAQRMNNSAKQAYTLVENLLHWSRVQSGLLKARPELINVNELLEEARLLCVSQAQAKNIELVVGTSAAISLFADRQMVATILRNFISNAIKFSFSDNIVSINALLKSEEVIIAVKDDGTGIAPEYKASLLELSNSFSSPGTASEAGTGLGLILCREFAELNKGRIYFESEFGSGTIFFLALPTGNHEVNYLGTKVFI